MSTHRKPVSGAAEPSSDSARFTGIHHCSVVVTDLERARRFYRDVLGLKPIHKPRTFGFEVAWFELGEDHVHLLPREEGDSTSPRHMALHVDDAQSARRYFASEGVEITETTPIPGADRFFIHDPDGNRIECIEWLRPYDSDENAPA